MNTFLLKYSVALAGTLIGGMAGFAYYYFVGCTTGNCAITANPVASSLYGMVLGYALFSMIPPPKRN